MQTLPTGIRAKATDHPVRLRGFTIIELVAIVGVLGLLLLVAVPSMQNFGDNAKVMATARDLASTISQMRQHSITTRQESWILYNFSDNSYHPASATDDGGISWLSKAYLPDGVFISRIVSAEQNGDNEITFYPTGLVEGHTIDLESEGMYATLEVNTLTGAVTIARMNK